MMKSIIIAALFVGVALSQALIPQTGPLNVVELFNGTLYSETLPVQASEATGYHLNLYKFWVPENVSTLVINVTNTFVSEDDACYLELYISSNGWVPCSEDEYGEDNYPCSNGVETTLYNDDIEVDGYFPLNPGNTDTDGLFQWTINGWLYMGVGREDNDDYASACTFTASITINSSCTPGSIGQTDDLEEDDGDDDEDVECVAYTFINGSSGSYKLTNTDEALYKLTLSSYTVGKIIVSINSTDDDLVVYGTNYKAPNDEFSCDNVAEVDNDDETTMYTFFCYVPRFGDYYIIIVDDDFDDEEDNTFNATVNIMVMDCNSMVTGMGGVNCTFPVVPCNTTWNNFAVTIPISATVDYVSGPFWYCWVNYTQNATGQLWNFNIAATGTGDDDNEYTIRKNGFPERYNEQGYEGDSDAITGDLDADSQMIGLTSFDYYEAGIVFVGLSCDDDESTSCSFTISANATVGPLTSGTSGSTSTKGTGTSSTSTKGTSSTSTSNLSSSTAMGTTGSGKTSGVAAVVPSIVVLAAAFVAMML